MQNRTLRVIRTTLNVLLVAAFVALVSTVALPHVLSTVDRQIYVVRGGSMTPGFPIGSAVVVGPVHPAQIRTGDVITFRVGSGSVVTHRVTAVSGDSQITFATKGDANNSGDPSVVPADAVIGRVEFEVPVLGYVLAFLPTVSGVVFVLGVFCTLILAGLFVDEVGRTVSSSRKTRAVTETAR